MSLTWTFMCCGISFWLGYRIKAQFEINQQSEIDSLKGHVQLLQKEQEDIYKKADYQKFLADQKYYSLERQFNNFKEQAKKDALYKIIKEEEKHLNPSLNFLKRL
ncbi:MAG: hypothetical protein HOP07_15800 [Bacteriovoracaceae bacterium]|nr:hypothetical protein [Bacteriovoracaceae bacterium]